MNDHRSALAHRILDRLLTGQLSRDHAYRAIDRALAWTGGPPSIDDVNAVVAEAGSARVR